MSKLDDYLTPLSQGVWEVTVDKEEVTEPLDEGWKISKINVPSPKTVASYRKGRFHVHETETQWKVHLDRYDPSMHPILHLVGDAPLMLMIGDTFVTLIAGLKRNDADETIAEQLNTQTKSWHLQVMAGIFLMLIGIFAFSNPVWLLSGVFNLVIPVIILLLGIATVIVSVIDAIKRKNHLNVTEARNGGVLFGLIVILIGIVAINLSLESWIAFVSFILMVWMFASAAFLLSRVWHGKKAVPEGFYSRMVIGILSLFLVLTVLIYPYSLILLLIAMISMIIFVIGLVVSVNGIRLWNLTRELREIAKN